MGKYSLMLHIWRYSFEDIPPLHEEGAPDLGAKQTSALVSLRMSPTVQGTCGSRRWRSKDHPERQNASKKGLASCSKTAPREGFASEEKRCLKVEAGHTLDELAGEEETKRPCHCSRSCIFRCLRMALNHLGLKLRYASGRFDEDIAEGRHKRCVGPRPCSAFKPSKWRAPLFTALE